MPLIPALAFPGSLCRTSALPLCLAPKGIGQSSLARTFTNLVFSHCARQLPALSRGRIVFSHNFASDAHRLRGLVRFHNLGPLSGKESVSRTTLTAPTASGEPADLLCLALHRRNPTLFHHKRLRKALGNVAGQEEHHLCSILARYVDLTSPTTVGHPFHLSSEERLVLTSSGYHFPDIELWASALLHQWSATAADILLRDKAPPHFVLVLLLHRTVVERPALQILLRHLRDQIHHERVRHERVRRITKLFIHHANRNWPECLPLVAELFIEAVSKLLDQAGRASTGYRARLTSLCNHFLLEFAGNVRMNPVVSAVYQEKAQFLILRFMAKQSPALIVTRDGFRALAKVQAAHRKTRREIEWTQLKSLSWPPWKMNKTGMDESRDVEDNLSRANQVIRSMREAGYGSRTWEDVLGIYAGQDTDGSPTIQQRTSLVGVPFHKPHHHLDISSYPWAARIQATRTRREAWACFLSYEESGTPPLSDVYLAIFEKIVRKEITGASHSSSLVPGDAKEVWPEPPSSHDAVYIKEPLPSFEGLWQRMMERGDITMDAKLLAFLLKTAPNFSLVMEISRSPYHDYISLRSLLDAPALASLPSSPLPPILGTAFIHCLLRFGRFVRRPQGRHLGDAMSFSHEEMLESDPTYRLDYSFHILSQWRPQYRPAWTAWMKAVVDRAAQSGGFSPVEAWKTCERLFGQMQEMDVFLDSEQFHLLCSAIEKAWRWSNGRGKGSAGGRWMTARRDRWVQYLRLQFHDFVSGHPDLPSGSGRVPDPATLHFYACVLGEFRDYEGLYSLTSWLTAHHQEVNTKANAFRSGGSHIRRTICALRLDLEGAPKELILLAKMKVNKVKQVWGPWPDADEIRRYQQLYR